MQIESRNVMPDQLLLDPNNYRFHDLSGYRPVLKGRYGEPGVQVRALQFLRDTASFELGALRHSVISNGFVPFEQIVVERYDEVAGSPRYLVVEGNRRTAAIKTILQDANGGAVDLRPEVDGFFDQFYRDRDCRHRSGAP